MNMILRIAIASAAIWLAALILPGLDIVGSDDNELWRRVAIILGVGLVFAIVSTVVKPLMKLLALPLIFLTLGLFTIVINGAVLWLVAWISSQSDWGLRIDNFGTALLAAIIVSIATFSMNLMTLGASRR